jgi:primosomal protein N' (replication factor Y)
MSDGPEPIYQVVLPLPLRRSFDYLPPISAKDTVILPGMRVSIPFGGSRKKIGIVVSVGSNSDDHGRQLKRIQAVLDREPLLDGSQLDLLQWASDYYQHPAGEVLFNALPALLRQGKPAQRHSVRIWRLAEAAGGPGPEVRGPRQRRLLQLLAGRPEGISQYELGSAHEISASTIASLQRMNLIRSETVEAMPAEAPQTVESVQLNPEQTAAAAAVADAFGTYRTFLLQGVTGSGKTEVYADLVRRTLLSGRQALVLVPEIGLTPQFIGRLRRRIAAPIVVLHSGLSESERFDAWLSARSGRAAVLVGTRSAVWTPLSNPGIFIVDEEHDPSYKQQDGFRYSARDVAVMRAREAGVPVLLGSATPSLEAVHNVRNGRYTGLRLSHRAGNALPPRIRIIDLRGQALDGALSRPLLAAIETEIAAGHQALLFLNRRGYSPVIMCHSCGWTAECRRCGVPLTFHQARNLLLCHHCGSSAATPAVCGSCGTGEILRIGHGTQRLAETLSARFPEARILRIDRDSTRRRGEMDRLVEAIGSGQADILVGTQMLAKGHDFPNLTLVGIVDADRGLFSADFRAGERMAQLIVQVSGRAGRARHPGTVMIQTHHPEHPLLNSLVQNGYEAFADLTLAERRDTGLPPFSYLALLRAENYDAPDAERFLQKARELLDQSGPDLQSFGPIPAPMERRAGRYRFQLLVQSESRTALGNALRDWAFRIESLPEARKVRWSLDVDPQDMI